MTTWASNVALVAVALEVGDPSAIQLDVDASTWLLLVAACAATSLLGFLLMFWKMVPRYRHTFYARCTVRGHVAETLWDAGTYTGRHGHRLADSRGRILKLFSRHYWPPKATVQAWVAQEWHRWEDEATRPRWVSKKFCRRFPKGWLPGELDFERTSSAPGQIGVTRRLRSFTKNVGSRVSSLGKGVLKSFKQAGPPGKK